MPEERICEWAEHYAGVDLRHRLLRRADGTLRRQLRRQIRSLHGDWQDVPMSNSDRLMIEALLSR